MDSPMVIAAIIGAIAGLFGSIPIGFLSYRLAERKFKTENGLNLQASEVVKALLKSENYEARSLNHIKLLLTGLTDEQIRHLLIEASAVRIEDKDGKEMWAHLDRDITKKQMEWA
ncbi:MAG: hypothetical protein GXP06_15215 [Alphaproteobacteria bacterium]|nr:hypothetical protein [Alphaproteobacteria bacterium]